MQRDPVPPRDLPRHLIEEAARLKLSTWNTLFLRELYARVGPGLRIESTARHGVRLIAEGIVFASIRDNRRKRGEFVLNKFHAEATTIPADFRKYVAQRKEANYLTLPAGQDSCAVAAWLLDMHFRDRLWRNAGGFGPQYERLVAKVESPLMPGDEIVLVSRGGALVARRFTRLSKGLPV